MLSEQDKNKNSPRRRDKEKTAACYQVLGERKFGVTFYRVEMELGERQHRDSVGISDLGFTYVPLQLLKRFGIEIPSIEALEGRGGILVVASGSRVYVREDLALRDCDDPRLVSAINAMRKMASRIHQERTPPPDNVVRFSRVMH